MNKYEELLEFFMNENAIDKDGDMYTYTIYPEYDDYLSDDQIVRILYANDPEEELVEVMNEVYEDEMAHISMDLEDRAIGYLKDHGVKDVDESEVEDFLGNNFAVDLPYEHYENQDVQMVLMLDTGDANYDYTLNCIYPAWGGSEEVDEKASLLWLVRQQGYSDEEFKTSLQNDGEDIDGFLLSVYEELANESGSINVLTVLVRMSLKDAMKLARLMRTPHDASNPDMRPACGSITVSKDATVGLFDPWNGGGSLLGIALDKDLVIPIKYIREADVDSVVKRYSIESVYGLSKSAWVDAVKSIDPPAKKQEAV